MATCKCKLECPFRWREQEPRSSIFLATLADIHIFGGVNTKRSDSARMSAEKNAALFYANLPAHVGRIK